MHPASAGFFFETIMKTVKSKSIADDSVVEWRLPTRREVHLNSIATWGKQFDRVERKVVEGGLPIVIERMAS